MPSFSKMRHIESNNSEQSTDFLANYPLKHGKTAPGICFSFRKCHLPFPLKILSKLPTTEYIS